MRKPEFEQFRRTLIRKAKALPQQAREPYRLAIVGLLEDTGLFLIQKARKDGHDEALLEIHGSWVGTDFSPDAVKAALLETWPGGVFGSGEQGFLLESEEEVAILQFAWDSGQGQFLTGRIKIVV
ncbi:MAG TPA: hypothetical protein VMI31_11865 [Fimbriimonadaceae bacterium]|nr:hypothetical protein [Fimbriimonadaceae bacterium]